MADFDPSKEPLYLRLNFCDIARFKVLAPIGDAVAVLWRAFTFGTDCECCLGTRLVVWTMLVAGGTALCL